MEWQKLLHPHSGEQLPRLTWWNGVVSLCCFFWIYNKAHTVYHIIVSCFQRTKYRYIKRKLHQLCPCWNNPTLPLSSWYRGLILYLLNFLVPGSSSVFANVSIDHWLHLVERVFAAWVIQLGVYHRALKHRGERNGVNLDKDRIYNLLIRCYPPCSIIS